MRINAEAVKNEPITEQVNANSYGNLSRIASKNSI